MSAKATETNNGKIECIGLSNDRRTNKWRITCPRCQKTFVPLTTRLAIQSMQCQHCLVELLADYNAEPPTVGYVYPERDALKPGETWPKKAKRSKRK